MALLLGVTAVLAGCSQSASTQNTSVAASTEDQSKQEQAPAKTDYPQKPIELIIPSSAGGGTDAVARIVANAVNKYLPNGQTLVAVNKAGAAGTIATSEVFQAKPDGYKLGIVTTGGLAIQPNYGKTPYKHDDFIPIAQFVASQNLLVVRKDAPWNTYEEWLEYVKANPGAFKYSTAGAGNTQHLAMEALNILEGIQTQHIPFEGAAPAMTALLGGHVDGTVVLVMEAKPYTDSGEFKVLANLGTAKTEIYPDAAFLKDKGFVGLDSWIGVVAPKGTPQEIVEILEEAFKKGMEDPAVAEQFPKIGLEPAYLGPQDFEKTIADTAKLTGDLAKQLGLVK